VNRQTEEAEENGKENQVNDKFQEVCEQVKVENPSTLLLPPRNVDLQLVDVVLIGKVGWRRACTGTCMFPDGFDTSGSNLGSAFLHLRLDLLMGDKDLRQGDAVSNGSRS
jgi:hypothetical protein